MAKFDLNVAADMKLSFEDELPIIVLREYQLASHVKGYHVYKNTWKPAVGECFKARREPENEYDKFAVAVESSGEVVGHLSKGKSGRFAKIISFFLRADDTHSCHIRVTGKRVNLGDGQGLQIPCTLILNGQGKYILYRPSG